MKYPLKLFTLVSFGILLSYILQCDSNLSNVAGALKLPNVSDEELVTYNVKELNRLLKTKGGKCTLIYNSVQGTTPLLFIINYLKLVFHNI